jgi:hypothetical protein
VALSEVPLGYLGYYKSEVCTINCMYLKINKNKNKNKDNTRLMRMNDSCDK